MGGLTSTCVIVDTLFRIICSTQGHSPWKGEQTTFIHLFIRSVIHSIIHSFICLFRDLSSKEVHRLFQNELSTECDLVLPLSLSSILFSLVSSSSCLCLLLLFPPLISFLLPYLQKHISEGVPKHVTNPVSLSISLVCRKFLSFLTLYSISSFLTRSVQQIFSNLLHHRISKLSRYFRSTFRSAQV